MKKYKKCIKDINNRYYLKMNNLQDCYISIAGLIGSGKTTLATNLGKVLNMPVFYEEVKDNPYLEDFYKDMKSYTFKLQVYLLMRRYEQQQVIGWTRHGGIQDRTIYEDLIFQKMLYESGMVDKRDYETCTTLFKDLSKSMIRPNFIIYLNISPETAFYRIHELRKREMEKNITLEYLQNLKIKYDEFMNEISKIIPVINIDYNKFSDSEIIARKIGDVYKDISNITYIKLE